MKKFDAGKASLLTVVAVFSVAALFFGKTLTSVAADNQYNGNGNGNDWNNKCKEQSKDRDFDLKCPDGYSDDFKHNKDDKDCRKEEGHNKYSYSDKEKDYKDCDEDWSVDKGDESKCVKDNCPTNPPVPVTPPVAEPTATPQASSDNGGSSNPPGAPVCGATVPGTPTIISAVRTGNSEKLTWSAVTNATYYSIVYGNLPGYQYGVANVGNVTSYTINSLSTGTTYHFAVNAVNDCMPGDPGTTGNTGGQVLGASTMAGTGSFEEVFYQAIMGIGATLSAIGVKGLKKVKKTSKK